MVPHYRSESRYRESRTLVRRLCRLPQQSRADFSSRMARLRRHFERFNVDASELCQWLMGLRLRHGDRGHPDSFGLLGDFLLEPGLDGADSGEAERDRWRLAVFDDVAHIRRAASVGERPIPVPLREAMDHAGAESLNPTAQRLFGRLRSLHLAHRLVLLKAAAEWIVARYRRGMANWVRHHEEWDNERRQWEGKHPELTGHVRQRFNDVLKSLKDPEGGGAQGVKRKNPRICPYERLRQSKDSCIYAGEKGHGPLCWGYVDFVKAQKQRNQKFNAKHFEENARKYIKHRLAYEKSKDSRPEHQAALERLYREVPQCKPWFEDAWKEYLLALGLADATALSKRRTPHCLKIGETWENSKCEWNPHTELCKQYKKALGQFDAETLKLEAQYRAWRRDYLAGPSKPSFRYPSSRQLPMPKVFGAGFHETDFDHSVLRLRLDDMPQGQWIEFGFTPWPRDYRPSLDEVRDKVTSVHVNFVGNRARVGFRFDAPHRPSRFACAQDEIDELRTRKFPRAAQDQQFLDAARDRLLVSFQGGAKGDLRLLAVDLGETGAYAAFYQGRCFQADAPLAILKLDKLYEKPPEGLSKEDTRGLRKQHVGRHLEGLADGATRIAEHRHQSGAPVGTVGGHDLRALKLHVAWMIRDWVRLNASQLMAAAEEHGCDLIVFESMRGFLPPGYHRLAAKDQDKKRRLAMFAYGRVRQKVTEKAVERGMRVVTVPYRKSSQYCSACQHEQKNKGLWERDKRRGKFECQCGKTGPSKGKGAKAESGNTHGAHGAPCECREKLQSDQNAARVLARVFWGEIVLPVEQEEA